MVVTFGLSVAKGCITISPNLLIALMFLYILLRYFLYQSEANFFTKKDHKIKFEGTREKRFCELL